VKPQSQSATTWSNLLGAAAFGALGMYFSDPERGRRRRAMAQDKLRHVGVAAGRATDVALRNFVNRMAGAQARARSVLIRRQRYREADDEVVAARIRSKLGRLVSRPHAISVAVRDGCAELCGPILEREKHALQRTVRGISGVREIHDRLLSHKHAPCRSRIEERDRTDCDALRPHAGELGPAVRGSAMGLRCCWARIRSANWRTTCCG